MEEKVIKNEIVLFENQDVKLEVNMKDETVWLNVNQMSELFGRDSKTIRKHINNALKEELDREAVVANFAIVELSIFSFKALSICFLIVLKFFEPVENPDRLKPYQVLLSKHYQYAI